METQRELEPRLRWYQTSSGLALLDPLTLLQPLPLILPAFQHPPADFNGNLPKKYLTASISDLEEKESETSSIGNFFSPPSTPIRKRLIDDMTTEQHDMFIKRYRASPTGEQRLVIAFEDFGDIGQKPQTFGKHSDFIPHGLKGTHHLYHENWEFEIVHEPFDYSQADIQKSKAANNVVQITYKITNLTTRFVCSQKETFDEALRRNLNGTTITSRVFREALKARANDLEALARREENETRAASLYSRAKALRPKQFQEGLLAFGLLHSCVQERMKRRLLEEQAQWIEN